jgi:hypothetical protein
MPHITFNERQWFEAFGVPLATGRRACSASLQSRHLRSRRVIDRSGTIGRVRGSKGALRLPRN